MNMNDLRSEDVVCAQVSCAKHLKTSLTTEHKYRVECSNSNLQGCILSFPQTADITRPAYPINFTFMVTGIVL